MTHTWWNAFRPLPWVRVAPLLVAAIVPASGAAQRLPPPLAQFLQQTIALDRNQLMAVSGGRPLAKALETPDRDEIAIFGIVRIDVPRSFYVRAAADFRSSLGNPWRTQLALFSDPASEADVAPLSVPHPDVDELRRCSPGSCNVKLSSDAMARVRAAMDVDSLGPDAAVNAFFRARLVEYVDAYRAHGDSALVQYDDQPSRTAAARVSARLLSRSPYLYEYAPSLERYLEHYPHDRPPGVHEVLFWSLDDLPNLRRTITVSHALVYEPSDLEGCTFIVAKLLYAAHYLDGALDLTAVVDQARDQAPGASGIYVVRLQRLHFDRLPSSGPLDVRGRVIGALRDRAERWLEDTKTRNERAHADAQAPTR